MPRPIFCDPGLTTGSDDGTQWENAYRSLQDALDNAPDVSGGEIWVKARTVALTATIVIPNTGSYDPAVYGGFDNSLAGVDGSVEGRDLTANITTLDATGKYIRCVFAASSWVGLFDGFKLVGGYVAAPGAGMWVTAGSGECTISNCEFNSCVSTGGSYFGGGLHFNSTYGSHNIINCTFINNEAYYGAALNMNRDGVITGCTFTENIASYQGGAMYVKGDLTVTDSAFIGNTAVNDGGALCIKGDPTAIVTLTRCYFDANEAAGYGGHLCTWTTTDITAVNCVFVNGVATNQGGAARIYTNSTLTATNCTFADNSCGAASGGGAVMVDNAGETLVATNCIFWGNEANSVANQIGGTGSITVTYSNVEGTYSGTGNVNADPQFVGAGDNPYALGAASTSVDSANSGATGYLSTDYLGNPRVDDYTVTTTGTGTPAYADMGAYEYQWVNVPVFCDPSATGDNDGSSWDNAYTSLQAAIDAPTYFKEIWVKARAITLTATIDVDNTNDPDIYGGFDTALIGTEGSVAGRALGTDITTLDGADTYRCVSTSGWEGTFDGFKLLNGKPVGLGNGGGILITSTGTVVISNCEFNTCTSASLGSMISCETSATLTIDNCTGVGNDGPGIYIGGTIAGITISNSTVTGNLASFAFYLAYTSHPTCYISNCIISSNNAGGMYYTAEGNLEATDCIFKNNTTSYYGGGVNLAQISAIYSHNFTRCYFDGNSVTVVTTSSGGHLRLYDVGSVTAENCTFVNGSAAGEGGAVYVDLNSDFTATNCTFADNSCSLASGGGAINCEDSGEVFVATNCIFWGNTANSAADQIAGAGSITVTYSDVEGGYTGTGNVNDDPLFKGTGDDPYDLSAASAAVDSGNSGATDYPTTDYLGRGRVYDPNITTTGTGTPDYSDMGAYEFQDVVPRKIFCDPSATGSNNGTSWENAYTYFQTAIDNPTGPACEVWVKARTITLSLDIDLDNTNYPDVYGGFDTALTGTNGSIAGRTTGVRTTLNAGNTKRCVKAVGWQGTFDGFKLLDGNGINIHGGGMYVDTRTVSGDKYVTISNCEFNSCTAITAGEFGGGLYVYYDTSAHLTIDKCVFTENSSNSNGGAFYAQRLSSITITDSTFTDNSSVTRFGSAIYTSASPITMSGCTFDGNTGPFSAVNLEGAWHTFSDCVFTGNICGSRGAVVDRATATLDFVNCIFDGNTCTSVGAHVYIDDTPVVSMTNCVFVNGYSASNGSAIYYEYGSNIDPTLTATNCTFADNLSSAYAAIYVYNTIFKAVNCIFWGNIWGASTTKRVKNFETIGTALVFTDYCNIQGAAYAIAEGSQFGVGNICSYPKFKGTGDHPYDLALPCGVVDAGNSGAANYPSTDILGRSRYNDPNTVTTGAGDPAYSDMGAYEFQNDVTPVFCRATATGDNDGTSWENAYTSLQAAIDAPTDRRAVWVTEGTITLSAAIDLDNTNYPDVQGGFSSALTGTAGNLLDRDLPTDFTVLDGADTYRCISVSGWEGELGGFKLLDGYHSNDGGGLYVVSVAYYSSIIVSNCEFNGCSAGEGGGIFLEQQNYYASTVIDTCVFTGNSASNGFGGGIYTHEAGHVTIKDSTFTSNTSTGGGGAAYLNHDNTSYRPEYIVIGTTFDTNTAASAGGAISSSYGSLAFFDCVFTDNETTTSYDSGGAVYAYAPYYCVIRGCEFTGNVSFSYSGGALFLRAGSTTMEITECYFDDNYGNTGGAIEFGGGATAISTNCVFTNNNATAGGAITLYQGSTLTATNCTFADNACTASSGGGAVYGRDVSGNILIATNCIFWGNTANLVANQLAGNATYTVTYCIAEGGYSGTHNYNADPKFIGVGVKPYDLAFSSAAVNAGNANATYYPATDYLGRERVNYAHATITGTGTPNYSDMGAYEFQGPLPIFCDPSATGANDGSTWEAAYTSLQAAIDAPTEDYRSIWVKGRVITLTATIDVDNTYNPDIYGGFDTSLTDVSGTVAGRDLPADITTLDGDDTYRCVTMSGWEGIFDGFKLLDGNAGLLDAGGIYVSTTGTVAITISNCEFNSCTTDNTQSGGGLYLADNTSLTVAIEDCLFTGNYAKWGAAIASINADTNITDSVFSTNTTADDGGAIHASGGAHVYTRCYFDANESGDFGGHVYASTAGVGAVNCVFVNGVSADDGGAIYLDFADVGVVNCTFADNSCTPSASGGAIMVGSSGTLVATNCIFWGNEAASVANQIAGSGSITVTYSDVQGTYTGTGNVNSDPNFLGTGTNPYNLSLSSGAVDSGDSWAVGYPTLDFLGQARYDDPNTVTTGVGVPAYSDMGAYEYQGAIIVSFFGSLLMLNN